MQVSMFETAIAPVWQQFDKENKGYITQEQFKELGKQVLSKLYMEKFYSESVFDTVCEKMVTRDQYNPEGHIGQRVAAEILNYICLGGL